MSLRKSIQHVLEGKGFDLNQINDILNYSPGLDIQVRKEFGLEDQPIHLWECYCIGDADANTLWTTAVEQGYSSIKDMLVAMDWRLIELASKL